MKELTLNEVTSVNGASYSDILYGLMPLVLMTTKGLLLCYKLNKNPASMIPAIRIVALSSVAGATIGHTLYDDASIGSTIGGFMGMVGSMHFGLDILK